MKILFIARSTLFTDSGGDTIQIKNTRKYLLLLGLQIDLKLTNEVIDYHPYDLIHFFNIIRPADILYHIRKSSKPYLVSTIYVDYSEFERFERKGIIGFVLKFLSSGQGEYIKAIARAIKNNEKIISPEYLWMGHRRSIIKVIQNSVLLLPNSNSEYLRLSAQFKIMHKFKMIPNGIDAGLFIEDKISDKDPLLILCVGRIEGRKNQLNLIKALNEQKYKLVIIGSQAINQSSYYEECLKEAGPNVTFIKNIPQEELIGYYKKAKVHVLPSWFETTGLSSLEAAAMGCNIVITDKGDTREYFGDFAFYCDPGSRDSIRLAVDKALQSENNNKLKDKVYLNYTWEIAAQKTLEAYRIALS